MTVNYKRPKNTSVPDASDAVVDAGDEVKTRITRVSETLPNIGSTVVGEACLVVIHSTQHGELGRCYVFDKSTLSIGRGRDNDIVLLSDAVSRRHSCLERRDTQVFAVDLDSTNGTFLNDNHVRKEQRLNRGDLLKVGDTIFKYLSGSDVEAQYHELIFRMAVTDGLTNLANRQQLDSLLNEAITRARRLHSELTILMVDIDHFKRVNDGYGHLAGDSVLRGVAAVLQQRLRPSDALGRYGGEEFCAILPDTALADGVKVAEELRTLVEGRVFATDAQQVRVTISIGAATWRPGLSRDELYNAADALLYSAKHRGRNRVCY